MPRLVPRQRATLPEGSSELRTAVWELSRLSPRLAELNRDAFLTEAGA